MKFTEVAHAYKKEDLAASWKSAGDISQSTFVPQRWFFLDLVTPDWCFSSVLIFTLLNGTYNHCADHIPRERRSLLRKTKTYYILCNCARQLTRYFPLLVLVNATKGVARPWTERKKELELVVEIQALPQSGSKPFVQCFSSLSQKQTQGLREWTHDYQWGRVWRRDC